MPNVAKSVRIHADGPGPNTLRDSRPSGVVTEVAFSHPEMLEPQRVALSGHVYSPAALSPNFSRALWFCLILVEARSVVCGTLVKRV